MKQLVSVIRSLAIEDDGVQVVEYALIIAVAAISLVIALGGMNNGSFSTLISRASTCLTTNACL